MRLQCPACPDGYVWTPNGPTNKPCPTCKGTAYIERSPPLDSFHEGDRVRYVPNHAHGDRNHPDCLDGFVTSTGTRFVFVRYGNKRYSEATDAEDLVKL